MRNSLGSTILNVYSLRLYVSILRQWYTCAMQRLFAQNNRNVSLVDCLSFEIMDSLEIKYAFAFDRHFEENGFTIAAFHNLDIK